MGDNTSISLYDVGRYSGGNANSEIPSSRDPKFGVDQTSLLEAGVNVFHGGQTTADAGRMVLAKSLAGQ